MGRGRAKAKQTKVARELKYNAPQTDLEALRAELSGKRSGRGTGAEENGAEENGAEENGAEENGAEEEDPYARYAADQDEAEDKPDSAR